MFEARYIDDEPEDPWCMDRAGILKYSIEDAVCEDLKGLRAANSFFAV
jgi:hypothetical protein